jgi:hypothetical protein
MKTIIKLAAALLVAASGAVLSQVPTPTESSTVSDGVKAATGITPEQRQLLDEKLSLIRQIMTAIGPDIEAQGMGNGGRRWAVEALASVPLHDLQDMAVPHTTAGLSSVLARLEKRANTKLGQTSTELVYIPITPCRYIDTRNVGGPISGIRAYDLDQSGTSYGGSAACDPASTVGIAADIGAIAINVTIVAPPLAPGVIGARPAGSTNTTSLVNWYDGGPNVQAANAAIIPTRQFGGTDEIEFFGGPAQVVVDVFGVFAAPTATALDCVWTSLGSTPIATGGSATVQSPQCPTGYVITGGSCETPGSFAARLSGARPSGNSWWCDYTNQSGGSLSPAAAARCCRVPGR